MLIELLFAGFSLLSNASAATPHVSQIYYVDCARGDDANTGDAESAPWKSLAKASSQVLAPGDSLLFRRGSVCAGTLKPSGSGRLGAPLTVGAYGVGPRPRIEGGKNEEAFKLYNQEYWDVESIELTGGATCGILVSGDRGVLHHIHLKDLSVHDVMGPLSRHADGLLVGPVSGKDSGLVVVSPGRVSQRFDDVLVDGVEAYNTNQWTGILIGGGDFGLPPESAWSTRAVVRNSIVHDVAGEGIFMARVVDGRLEKNVAWHTGMQRTANIGTPNAIWTWMCHGCVVRDNEAFLTDSPGLDGGAFDIDWGNIDNSVIDNYGHDTQGYCAAVFAAWGIVTKNSVVRGNVCARNGLSPRLAQSQGAMHLDTWNGGSLDGVAIESNTIDWTPSGAVPMVIDDARLSGPKIVFRGNLLISDSPLTLYSSTDAFELDGNRSVDRNSLSRAGDPDEGSMYEPPRLEGLDGRPLDPIPAAWTLYSFLQVSSSGSALNDDSRSQIVVLKSLLEQFRPKGLRVALVLPAAARRDAFRNASEDWGLEDMVLAAAPAVGGEARTILVSPKGKLVKEWPVFSGPATLGYEARRWLGEPVYSRLPMVKGPI